MSHERVIITEQVITRLIEKYRSSGGSHECAARGIGIPVLLLRHWMFLGERVAFEHQTAPSQYDRFTDELKLLEVLWDRIETERLEMAEERYQKYLEALEDVKLQRVAERWLADAGRLCADYAPGKTPAQHEAERQYLARWSESVYLKFQAVIGTMCTKPEEREAASSGFLQLLAAQASYQESSVSKVPLGSGMGQKLW